MNLYKRILITSITTVVGILSVAGKCEAQQPIWSNYSVQYINVTYTSFFPGDLIPVTSFLNSSGMIDPDDGTAVNIPVGFNFDYNGNKYSSVDVNVNGYVTLGDESFSVTPYNSGNLFSSDLPNNTLAPYWGDHYYRTVEPDYAPTRIAYSGYGTPDSNPNSPPFASIPNFILQWSNLNINDKTNPNSVASFQLLIHANPKSNDMTSPDKRATIEFRYGTIDTSITAVSSGATVGVEDSTGFSYLNALFATLQFNGDSTRLSKAKTTCWPPAHCTPGIAIQIVPVATNASVSEPMKLVNGTIQIYPNPTSNLLHIESLSNDIVITDLLGRTRMRAVAGDGVIDVSSLPQGVYSIGDGKGRARFVKE